MPLTIGCDPEFITLDQNGAQINSNFSHDVPMCGNIGADHGNRVGEFRPEPGTPAQVVTNLKHLFLAFKQRHPNYKIVAGGGKDFNLATGGHIHFGITWDHYEGGRFNGRHRRQPSRLASATNQQKLIAALDYFLGLRLKKVGGGARASGLYGRPSDTRSQPHGFEYRTPPSWITDPILTESVLAIAYRIAQMWLVKPTAFDEMVTKKRIARKREYSELVPEGSDRNYYQSQVSNFKRLVFSKTYKMNSRECVAFWTEPQRAAQAIQIATARRSRVSTAIVLQVCQLKIVVRDRGSDFEHEQVFRTCRFAVPEVKIYQCDSYTPWHLQLNRDTRLRPNTIYFSKELRPYLKIPRGGEYRVRFIEVRQRTLIDGQTNVRSLANSVFYNSTSSDTRIKDEITRIFQECVRKRLRRDAEV